MHTGECKTKRKWGGRVGNYPDKKGVKYEVVRGTKEKGGDNQENWGKISTRCSLQKRKGGGCGRGRNMHNQKS